MKETIEKINGELQKFWNKNQKKHPAICKYLELSGTIIIEGGAPILAGGLFGALCGTLAGGPIGAIIGTPIGILILFEGALLQFKPHIDEKYKEIKKQNQETIISIVDTAELQQDNNIVVNLENELENLSEILKKHRLDNEARRKKFFEDELVNLEQVAVDSISLLINEYDKCAVKDQKWGKDIKTEINDLQQNIPLIQHATTSNLGCQ